MTCWWIPVFQYEYSNISEYMINFELSNQNFLFILKLRKVKYRWNKFYRKKIVL